MRGRILGYNGSDFRGLIAGQDGQRYDFVRVDWQGAGEPALGMDVDFRIDATMAKDIFPLAPSVAQPAHPAQPYPPYGQPGQAQPNPAHQPYGQGYQAHQTYQPYGQTYAPPPQAQTQMGFGEAINICFKKYATFSGRARRAEYWYFFLFTLLAQIVASILDAGLGMRGTSGPISGLLSLGLLVPSLAVLTRRLHDTDRSGFWALGFYGALFFCAIGLGIGLAIQSGNAQPNPGAVLTMLVFGLALLVISIWIFVLTVLRGTNGSNRYGPDPLSTPADVF